MKHYKNKGTTQGFFTIVLLVGIFVSYQIFGENSLIWIFYIGLFTLAFFGLNNKTKMVKNKKTGHYEEKEFKRSTFDQLDFDYIELNKLRKAAVIRQEKLSVEKAKRLFIQQKKDKVKIQQCEFEETGLMNKIYRLKKLYINGTLNKAEFEKAKNKLLK